MLYKKIDFLFRTFSFLNVIWIKQWEHGGYMLQVSEKAMSPGSINKCTYLVGDISSRLYKTRFLQISCVINFISKLSTPGVSKIKIGLYINRNWVIWQEKLRLNICWSQFTRRTTWLMCRDTAQYTTIFWRLRLKRRYVRHLCLEHTKEPFYLNV